MRERERETETETETETENEIHNETVINFTDTIKVDKVYLQQESFPSNMHTNTVMNTSSGLHQQ